MSLGRVLSGKSSQRDVAGGSGERLGMWQCLVAGKRMLVLCLGSGSGGAEEDGLEGEGGALYCGSSAAVDSWSSAYRSTSTCAGSWNQVCASTMSARSSSCASRLVSQRRVSSIRAAEWLWYPISVGGG